MGKSLYRGWDDTITAKEHDVTVTKPGWGRKQGAQGRPQDFSRMRRARPVDTLLPATIDWILALPPHVRPHQLAKRFPRIANTLWLGWNDGRTCRRYFDDLLTDRRGGRQGFPAGMRDELRRLRLHYEAQPRRR